MAHYPAGSGHQKMDTQCTIVTKVHKMCQDDISHTSTPPAPA